MNGTKYVPSIGDYLCLTKRSNNYKVPYKVIDVTKDKIAIQECEIVDRKNQVVKPNDSGAIVLLSWKKDLGWHWKRNKYDDDPEIAEFYTNYLHD